MAANLNDVVGWIKDIFYRLRKLESGSFLESSSISYGRMRFIGGTLMIDSGGQFVVIGSASVDGTMTINGTFLLTGSGWRIVGSGSIEGPTTVVGTLQIDGDTRITGNLSLEGDASLTGTLDVDGTGRILVGDNMRLDPASDGGAVLFSNGSKLYSNTTAIGVRKGSSALTVGDALATLLSGGKYITVADDGITFGGIREVTSTDGVKWLGITTTGEVVMVAPGVGGPGGSLSWPLPPSTVTDEYGPRESPGEGASTFHEGIDFGAPNGTPIPSAGSGTVEFAGFDSAGGYGYYVLINHGSGLKTRYAHMNGAPAVTTGSHVARGQILGEVGNTGTSFGNHLHFEVEVDGVRVNPRTKLPAA